MRLFEQFREDERDFASGQDINAKFKGMLIHPSKADNSLPPKLSGAIHQDNKKFWLSQYNVPPKLSRVRGPHNSQLHNS